MLKKKTKIICSVILLICLTIIAVMLVYVYINTSRKIPRENISSIEIDFNDFSGRYVFSEKANIDIALELEEYLRKYISPRGTFGLYQTIEYKIIYDNGNIITKKYKNVYPVNKIFQKLFNSEEYKTQALDIFKSEIFEIEKIILYADPQDKRYVEITDKNIINDIIISLREYYLEREFYILNDSDDNSINTIKVNFPENTHISGSYIISPNNKKAIEVLKGAGIYNKLVITSDDLKFITVHNGNISVDVYDREIIKLAIEKSGIEGRGTTVMRFTGITKSGFKINGNFYRDSVPEKIEKLFE